MLLHVVPVVHVVYVVYIVRMRDFLTLKQVYQKDLSLSIKKCPDMVGISGQVYMKKINDLEGQGKSRIDRNP